MEKAACHLGLDARFGVQDLALQGEPPVESPALAPPAAGFFFGACALSPGLGNFVKSCKLLSGVRRVETCTLSPDPDFEEFALDCIRLSNQEKSPILRRKLLTLAREWMHAAMHQQGAEIHQQSAERMDANSGEAWSDIDISD